MIHDSPPCTICAAPHTITALSIRQETRRQPADASDRLDAFIQPRFMWVDGAVRAVHHFCPACTSWVTNLMSLAADSERQPDTVLGLPVAVAATELGDGHCDYCRAELLLEAMGLDLMPISQGSARERGHTRQQRLCRQCATWWVALLDDPASLRGQQARAVEGPIGHWLPTRTFDAAELYLSRRDEYVIRATLEDQGHSLRSTTTRTIAELPPRTPIFVTAGRKSRARRVVLSVPPERRRYVIVVARIDCQDDTSGALVAGAGDFLVSPLSPQQVLGAMERISEGVQRPAHEPSGLPILPAKPAARGGDPGHMLSFGASDSTMTTALLARRFLRGYDRVGVNANGELVAHVACPQEASQVVVTRLTSLLGTTVRVRFSTPAIMQAAA